MYKYENVSDVEQTIIAEGEVNPRVVKPGEVVTSSVPLENPNFKFLGAEKENAVQGVVTQPQPNAVIEAENVTEQTNKENE